MCFTKQTNLHNLMDMQNKQSKKNRLNRIHITLLMIVFPDSVSPVTDIESGIIF